MPVCRPMPEPIQLSRGPEFEAAVLHTQGPGPVLAALESRNVVILRQLVPPWLMAKIYERALQVYAERQRIATEQAHAAGNPIAQAHVTFVGIPELDLPGGPPHQVLNLFINSPLRLILRQLLGSPIFFNLAESACRKILADRPELLIPAHQDGFFDHQPPWRHINCWFPLVPCGIDAPGLEVLPAGLNTMLSPTQPGKAAVAKYGFTECEDYVRDHPELCWHPALNPGDVLIMNEYAIHRSYGTETMTRTRYNMELRFVSGANIPEDLQRQYGLIRLPD